MGKGIRSPGRDIYSVNFADYLTETLKRDPKMKALAAAVTEQMLGVSGEIDNVLIYSRIDELSEELIDILAFDMHVDWYDYSYPLTVKKDILKNSVKVHKKMGTKYSLEMVLKNINKTAEIKEWFEYGGKPYTFRVNADIGTDGLDSSTDFEFERKLQLYKNLRSHCKGIFYTLSTKKAKINVFSWNKANIKLKVKPLLQKDIKTAGNIVIMAISSIGVILKVKPLLDTCITIKREKGTAACLQEVNIIEVKSYIHMY